MILYSADEIKEIKTNLENGTLKFQVGKSNLVFSKSGGEYLIQRVENKYLGLSYEVKDKTLIWNYPHIRNKKETDVFDDGYVEPKYNGTNYGIIIGENGKKYFRTRGSINPEIFLNTINSGIVKDELPQGILADVFKSKEEQLKGFFEKGKALGYCDDFGNFILKKVNETLSTEVEGLLGSEFDGSKLVGMFGEIISPFNPIAVDKEMKYGQYSFDSDFKYVVFDILLEKNGQYEFASPELIEKIIPKNKNIEPVEYMKLDQMETMLGKYNMEEGVMIKTGENYFKAKREEVLEWERMMGRLSNVLRFSIEHVISELGFSKEEVMTDKSYTDVETLDKIKFSVWNEISQYNISKNDLINYYKGENELDREFDNFFDLTLLTGITSVLASAGIPKERLYLEIPNYYYFAEPPLVFNEKRKKLIPANKKYSRIIGSIIGKVYQKRQ